MCPKVNEMCNYCHTKKGPGSIVGRLRGGVWCEVVCGVCVCVCVERITAETRGAKGLSFTV